MTYQTFPGNKIFPIKTDTGCMLKWNWSSILLNSGTTSSCHRCQRFPIDPDNFDNFHNIPEKIAAREKMLDGQWPGQGCEYCRDIESAGGHSDRLMQLERHHGVDKIAPELSQNPTATSVTPTTLEVWFNNTCNMTCVYCNPIQSSKWSNEIKKFGPINVGKYSVNNNVPKNLHYDQMVEQLWKYLDTDNRSSVIRHFQILGGEPFLQKELDQCIDFWASHPNPSLTINVITNLMIPHEAFKEKVQRFQALYENNSILRLQLTASLDGWGIEEEYVRQGLDLQLWEKNFKYLLDKPWCQLGINSCISSLSLKNISALVKKINEWNQLTDQAIDWSFELIIADIDSGLHPEIFGPDFFKNDFEKIISLMPENSDYEIQARKHFEGLAKRQLSSVYQAEKVQNLVQLLTQLDLRRGTNWRETFKEIAEFVDA
jgi:pyruvate-formate lyase-activating enzyme